MPKKNQRAPPKKSSKKKMKNIRRISKRQVSNQKQNRPKAYIAPCTQSYAMTLHDPFRVHGIGLPCTPVIPSLKTEAFSKATVETGTAQVGFIQVDPLRMIASDTAAIWASNATFTGSQTETAGVGVVALTANSPYTNAQFTGEEGGLSFRVVSCGLRVRYIGTELNRGGELFAVSHPSHADINQMSLNEARALNTTKIYPVTKDWVTVLWCPVLPNDYSYTSAVPNARPVLAILYVAPSGTVGQLEYEAHVNYEVVGAPARGMTRSMADPIGFSAVQQALQGSQMSYHATDQAAVQRSLIDSVEDTISNKMSSAASWLWNHSDTILETVGSFLL